MNEDDIIVGKYYVMGDLFLSSPLIVGSGEDIISDKDFIRNWDDELFIPATSVAGACRHYLDKHFFHDENEAENKLIREVFGEIEKNSTQSLIIFYDCDNFKDIKINLRDGVDIDYYLRVAKKKAKFNYEIIEPGASCRFRIELTIRAKKNEKAILSKIENLLYLLLEGFINKKIQLGAKTTRGFGNVLLKNCKILKLDLQNEPDRNIWINFRWNDWENWEMLRNFEGLIDLNQLTQKDLVDSIQESKMFKIELDFLIPYSLLIRTPNPNPGGEDVAHLLSNGEPAIPGTSWAGVLQNAIFQIAWSLNRINDFELILKELFGYVETKTKDLMYKLRAQKSLIYIKESIIKNSKLFSYTRNKIDRFTGGTIEGALFSEKVSYQGNVKLEIVVKDYEDYHIGAILLGIKELWYGLQPVGGSANIGRGILEGKNLIINGKESNLESIDLNTYYSALYEKIS